MVFLVSNNLQFVSEIKELRKAVFVAIALISCMQLSTNRSPVRIEIESPLTLKAISPNFTLSPSFSSCSTFKVASTSLNIILASSIPAITPLSFISRCALFFALEEIQEREL